ncbi:MAG: serine/threonine protein kinase [Myxococcaceae bacterium]|nr:serine/threonine protein kinase [Myxococcaceae bacterium]
MHPPARSPRGTVAPTRGAHDRIAQRGFTPVNTGTIVGGKYRLSREIGQGSMGSVWAAVHMLLDREVAIKFLNPSFEDPTTAAARFVAEAKASALVKHRFVVDVFDFGITDSGVSYMVQELLEGDPLSEVMCEGPAWPLRDAVRFMMDCLSGLSAVHERGIIHRDLKPENIFVLRDSDGRHPKLLDFGISKSAEVPRDKRVPRPSLRTSGRTRLTAVGSTLGTPAYMSPEQLRNLRTLDARADLYSLGVVFYEWLVGHCPFATTMNFAVLVDRIEAREMQPLEQLRPELGPELCATIARAIEPDRSKRYASAAEMRSALAEVIEYLPHVSTKMQNELPVYVPKGLPPPSITYRPRSPLSEAPRSLRPVSDSALSLHPAGLRRAPSRGFWLGAVAVGLVLAATPIALRARSHEARPGLATQPAAAARPFTTAAASAPTLAPPPEPAGPDLPFGALPPEPEQERGAFLAEPGEPERPAALVEANDQARAASEPQAGRRHHGHHRPARAPASTSAHASGAAAPPAAPKPQPSSASASPNKLLRSLDF